MSKQNVSDIEKKVMDKIQAGQARIKPRIYFTFLSALSVLAVVLFGFASAYFISIVSLWLRIEAAMGPARGARRNLASLIEAFPWWSLLLGVVSLMMVAYFVRRIGNLYKLKIINIVAIVIAISLAVGLVLSYTSLPSMFNKKHGFYSTSESIFPRDFFINKYK